MQVRTLIEKAKGRESKQLNQAKQHIGWFSHPLLRPRASEEGEKTCHSTASEFRVENVCL
jgi:hypothetical protein